MLKFKKNVNLTLFSGGLDGLLQSRWSGRDLECPERMRNDVPVEDHPEEPERQRSLVRDARHLRLSPDRLCYSRRNNWRDDDVLGNGRECTLHDLGHPRRVPHPMQDHQRRFLMEAPVVF